MTEHVMTEDDKYVEVCRQLRAGGAIFCPWCKAMNGPDMQPCCYPYRAALERRANEQLQLVIEQYKAVEIGMTDAIDCPYCGKCNRAPDHTRKRHPSEWIRPMQSPFCCDLMQMAAYAVIERKRTEDYMRHAQRIGESIDKAARN